MSDTAIRSIIDTLPAAIMLVDDARHIITANKAAKTQFGKDIEGRNFVHALRHPTIVDAIDNVLDDEEERNITINRTGSEPVSLAAQISPLDNNDNNNSQLPEGARAIVIIDDISHLRAAEQMRSDFVANVSHELRSPLTAMAGFIETLQGAARNDPEAQQRFLELMENEAARMNRLVKDLLSLSKVESNERIRPGELADLESTIDRVVETLTPQAEAAGKKIKLIASRENKKITSIPGNEDELTQIFHNLIENALKYSKENSVVSVEIKRLNRAIEASDSTISISVSDQGEGIERHHLPRLTERFYRIDSGRSRSLGGTGLGLAIVKHIVQRHRGRLKIDSEIGKGSTFTVLLPADF